MTIMKKNICFAAICIMLFFTHCSTKEEGIIMTVKGPIPSSQMGVSLIHEHILVDFIGADSTNDQRWDKAKVAERALPFLRQLKELGCRTLVECTPSYLGKDPVLLGILSDSSGLNILTNTGYYGAANDKYIPEHAYNETADQLAARWISEWENGIAGTGIKPGFIKIRVADTGLSDLHKKLIILKSEGVAPEAFIWVHAQGEKDLSNHVKAAGMGCWIGLDGLNDNNLEEYAGMIRNLKENKLIGKILLSHDAGWYRPGVENGGEYRGYTTLFEKLIPLLLKENFSDSEIHQLMVLNPSKAFEIGVRRIK
jgi:phosphotriesterase-related protein